MLTWRPWHRSRTVEAHRTLCSQTGCALSTLMFQLGHLHLNINIGLQNRQFQPLLAAFREMRKIDAVCHLVPKKKNCPFLAQGAVGSVIDLSACSALPASHLPGFLCLQISIFHLLLSTPVYQGRLPNPIQLLQLEQSMNTSYKIL